MADHGQQVWQTFSQATAFVQQEVERIQAQLEYGQALCELHPRDAKRWQVLLTRATELARTAIASGSLEQIRAAAQDVERLLAPLAKVAKSYTIYLVGHAHIDMNWMWSWPETVAVTNDTFTTVLRLLEEFPDFVFSQSQASTYALIQQHHPELFAKIAAQVRAGRWEVTASHWVEGDKNMASGESLCRHLLVTRRYLQQVFGLSPEDVPIDWSPDTFGHAHTVPTYLVRGGVKYLYLHRPGTHGVARPGAFWWQAPDGARVLTRNDMALGYNGVINPTIAKHLVTFVKETGLPFSMYVYGVGDHGGGPTRRDLLRAGEMNAWPIFPRLQMSKSLAFYDRLAAEGSQLPTLNCELNVEFTGCYTTETLIKKDNRIAERKLVDTETAAALSHAVCAAPYPYPTAGLLQGWKDTLFSHFHDILPGSGVHDTRTYTHGLFQNIVAMTAMEETKALRALAAQVDTSAALTPPPALPSVRLPTSLGSGVGAGSHNGGLSAADESAGHGPRPYLIFNPLPEARTEVIEAMLWENVYSWRGQELPNVPWTVRASDGTAVPAQFLETGNYWGHQFVKLAFPVKVGPCGYDTYRVTEEKTADIAPGAWHLGKGHNCFYAFFERSPEGLENDLIAVELDPSTGGIRTLLDKASGLPLISAAQPAPALEYVLERAHAMTAWTLDHTGPIEQPKVLGLQRKARGPHKASIDVRVRIHESEFTLTYELRAGDPNLYLKIAGVWFERGTPATGIPTLRLAFPVAVTQPAARYEIPFGAIDRDYPYGQDVPALNWAQVSGKVGAKPAGLLLLNDSKHGHSLSGNTLRLTLIRSSYDPDILPEIGQHEVNVALRPFAGDLPVTDAIRAGRTFNHHLRVVSTDAHAGQLPSAAALVTPTAGDFVLGAIKQAEDEGDTLILRFHDASGRAGKAGATLSDLAGKVLSAVEVDLLERPLAKSSAKVKGQTVTVALPARGIASVKVKLQRWPA